MKVQDYGDMLAQVKGLPLLAYQTFGSYSGDWLGALDAGDNVEIWKGCYGSCSGCDFLEAERGWDDNEISGEKAREYFKEDHPFAVIPKSTIKDATPESFEQMLPANLRQEVYDFVPEDFLKKIHAAI